MSEDDIEGHRRPEGPRSSAESESEPVRHVRRPRPHGRRALRPDDVGSAEGAEGTQAPEGASTGDDGPAEDGSTDYRDALEEARRSLRERRTGQAEGAAAAAGSATPAHGASRAEADTDADVPDEDDHPAAGPDADDETDDAQGTYASDAHADDDDEHDDQDDQDGPDETHHPLAGIAPEARRRRSPLHLLPIVLVLVVVLALGAGGVYAYNWLTGNVNVGQSEPDDYTGSGSEDKVVVEVSEGDSGSDIAATLVDHDVIKSSGPFVHLFGASEEASQIQPGSYELSTKMSSSSALDALLDPSSLTGLRVTIPEGMRSKEIYERISKTTHIPVKDFEEAAKHYTDYGIPKNPADSPEGYLWPGRYDIPEDATAGDVLTMMWERMDAQLDDLDVQPKDRHRVLTLASVAEKEARNPEDYGKVVRTLENRLEGAGDAHGSPMKLQLDSTVSYLSESDTVSTTAEERAEDTPYNTYKHEGLPIGPISNPGRDSLEAAVDPPQGEWLYWVTVDTEKGDTKFADTYSEHEKNVKKWKDWARERDAKG